MAKKHGEGFVRLVDEARKNIRETTPEEVRPRLGQCTLVDVREKEEWDAGRIPGAVHLSKGVIERDVEEVFPDRDAELVLYCGGGYRSALAAENLQKMGYTNVLSMDGGWRRWNELAYPVE